MSENKQQVPLFIHSLKKRGKPVPGMRVEVCPGVGPEERLRYFAHPLHGIVCRGHVKHPAFTPGSSEVQLFFVCWLVFGNEDIQQMKIKPGKGCGLL